jgi:AcrR family transcriptional regulator
MSHEVQTDLRVQRTHKFLQEAMIELITEKGFDAITVGDIAERAMINRATFYRHYQDKYDLVTKIFEEATDELMENMKHFRKDPHQNIAENPPEIWIKLFEHVAEHARLYRAMLGKNGSSWFAARMREHFIKMMLEKQLQNPQMQDRSKMDPSMPQELPGIQLSHALIGTIVWWLESEKSYTPRQIASWFCRFAVFGYLSAIGYEVPAAR